jgi:hypothetical protein
MVGGQRCLFKLNFRALHGAQDAHITPVNERREREAAMQSAEGGVALTTQTHAAGESSNSLGTS